jgi:lipopolysaccharide export system permease protein
LYAFLLPKVFIFTLPITFFVALAIVLFKLSRENEIIVLFTLGHAPKKIARFFLVLAFLLSSFLTLNVLVLMPLSKDLQTNFIDYKKAEARFNIQATEFGQKFSDWFVFVNGVGKDYYKGIVLYSEQNDKDRIVSASEAFIRNDRGEVGLELKDGKAYEVTNSDINQLNFETMLMRTFLGDSVKEVGGIGRYWSDLFTNANKAWDFTFYLLIALFPLSTTFFALSFGIVSYRYERISVYFMISLVIISYFAIVSIFGKIHPIGSLVAIFTAFYIVSLIVFKYRTLKRF